jgi:hypothetical protein
MQLDPEHVSILSNAFSLDDDGQKVARFDIPFMMAAVQRLNLWERGLLMQVLLKAANANRKTPEQRLVLALFVHRDGAHE